MSIKNSLLSISFLGLFSVAGLAQTAQDQPLSAIDWLSDVIREATPETSWRGEFGDDIAKTAAPQTVITTPLGQISTDAVGLLSRDITGFPADFWGATGSRRLQDLILRQRSDLPPPLNELLQQVLLAELDPPVDSTQNSGLLLARIDKLLDLGALQKAQALVEQAGPKTPQLFRRWFDISLLTGREDAVCPMMLDQPDFAPTYPARIFCLARSGDWEAATLTLDTARLLDVISTQEDDLLSRFLHPELAETRQPLPPPTRLTPLEFRMRDAIGEPLPLAGLPNAFAYELLDNTKGWKTRIMAAERLVRTGAIAPESLMAIYAERSPAASGGVWDRASAVQNFEAALKTRNAAQIARHQTAAMHTMRSAGLGYVFAQAYGQQIAQIPGKDALRDASYIILMSPAYDEFTQSTPRPKGVAPLLYAVARGDTAGLRSDDPTKAAIIAAFFDKTPPQSYAPLLRDGNYGQALLEALRQMEDGARSDPNALEQSLRLLRALDFEDVARRTALFILLSQPQA